MKQENKRIEFIAPLPPPLHGQAFSTFHLQSRLIASGLKLIVIDTNDGSGGKAKRILRRLARHTKAAAGLVRRRPKTVYLSVNSNLGMILTLLLMAIARLVGARIFLHHHTYGHIAQRRWIMTLITLLSHQQTVHICICEPMAAGLRRAYRKELQTITLSNVQIVDPILRARPRVAMSFQPRVLGHLSNLSEAKGVVRAIAAFAEARRRGLADRLVIAGPASDNDTATALFAAHNLYGDAVDYRGAVEGEEKRRFFFEIDLFLFPSLYANETQGIVNLEALASGVPVIAFGLCCIPNDLSGSSCRVVPPDQDFTAPCCDFLGQLATDWPAGSRIARERFDKLRIAGQQEENALYTIFKNHL